MTVARRADEVGQDVPESKSAEAFRTIGEAAAELGLKTHVLRFWETKFDNLKPLKRPDGRRYYRPDDMALLRQLQSLLHVQGLTIRGALKALKQPGEDAGPDIGPDIGDESGDAVAMDETLAPETLGEVAAPSVRDLQAAVRDAVERGDFRADAVQQNDAARARLESLLADLTGLKSRLDAVRAG